LIIRPNEGVAVDRTGQIGVWEVSSGKRIMTLRHECDAYSVAFSPDGTFIAASSFNEILLWQSVEPEDGYEPRRKGVTARKLVDSL